ncbi:MAG: gluconate permease [Pirellulales bacterium]|nr:gluconate permease [Pirellulales bacterium]
MLSPPWILAIGVAVVMGSILWLRLNAFLGLITAALAVSLLAPGEPQEKAARVAAAFGETAGGIGVAIVLASVVGCCLVESGAADRIVAASLAAFGKQNAATALAASAFVLAVPVFFDTVFYLLLPLAVSMYRQTGKQYLRYLLAIGAGGTVTHTMVPPTPGPLLMAEQMGVGVGTMSLAGIAVGVPMLLAGLAFAAWRDRTLALANLPLREAAERPVDVTTLPPLTASLTPIALPIALISLGPLVAAQAAEGSWLAAVGAIAGEKNVALFVAAIAGLVLCLRYRRRGEPSLNAAVEGSVLSAGGIVLITAAGGAFGAMLRAAQVGEAIGELFPVESRSAGFAMLWISFGVASLLKTSQGSTTVAIITASSLVAAMREGMTLPFHPVYLCTAIGSGAIVTSWMNDSGFWVYCRMGGVSEREGLRTWSPLMIVLGVTGMASTLLLAALWPGAGGTGGP